MKTKKIDNEALNNQIRKELGINLEEYRNEQIADNLVELLIFPSYIVSWIIRPVIVALLLFIMGYFIIDLVHIEYVIYTLLGFALFFITGFIVGLWLLSYQMKQDIRGILNFVLEIMSNVVQDVKNLQSVMRTNEKSQVLNLLFSGIIHITIIPVISDVISNKIKFGGMIVESFIKTTLNTIASKINFQDVELKSSKKVDESLIDTSKNSFDSSLKALEYSQNGINRILDIAFKIGQFPIKAAAIISILTTFTFLYFIW